MKKNVIDEPSFHEELTEGSEKELTREDRIYGKSFTGITLENVLGMRFSECKFDHVTFTGSMRSLDLADVIFDGCDLSNVNFSESGLRRVLFRHCRLVGTDCSLSSFQHVQMEGCRCTYLNLNGAVLKHVSLSACDFTDASVNDCRVSDLRLSENVFVHTEFLSTPLKDLDFSDSEMHGISVNPQSVSGMIVNASQAVELVSLLGIVVKE